MYSFTSKLIGGTVMTHRVDMKELLSKLNTFDNQFSKIKNEILDKQNINFSTVNFISIIRMSKKHFIKKRISNYFFYNKRNKQK